MMWSQFAKPLCPPTGDYWCGSPWYPLFFTLVLRGHSVNTAPGRPVRWPRHRLAVAPAAPAALVWWCMGPLLVLPRDTRFCVNPDRYSLWTCDITKAVWHKRLRVRSCRTKWVRNAFIYLKLEFLFIFNHFPCKPLWIYPTYPRLKWP